MPRENKGAVLYREAKKLIPGGTQLLSKRPEMFLPERWPSYYKRCKGIEVWDLDDNRYLDFSICGVGACVLGYADPDVDNAVIKAVESGNMCTLNVPEEVELASMLCRIHPWAKAVKYARTGGEAMAIAVRIARAFSGKEKILFCGYHGWHDWYLAANLEESSALDGQLLPGLKPNGVPRSLYGTIKSFYYNKPESLEALVNKYENNIAAVVMEPVRSTWPEKGFIEKVRRITAEKGITLIFDEVTSGLRMTSGGIHLIMGVEPDIAVFAKSLGNGYPMAAIIGRSKVMNAAQESFISSTYWTDKIGPSAALATLKKHIKNDVSAHLIAIGNLVRKGWEELSHKHALDIEITGIPPLSRWKIKSDNSEFIHTAIVSKMLEKGFLTSNVFYSTYAHTIEDVKRYLLALDEVLGKITRGIKTKSLKKIYNGPVAHSGFRRLA